MKMIFLFWGISVMILLGLSILMLCDDIADLELNPRIFKAIGFIGFFGASLSGATMLLKELFKK